MTRRCGAVLVFQKYTYTWARTVDEIWMENGKKQDKSDFVNDELGNRNGTW